MQTVKIRDVQKAFFKHAFPQRRIRKPLAGIAANQPTRNAPRPVVAIKFRKRIKRTFEVYQLTRNVPAPRQAFANKQPIRFFEDPARTETTKTTPYPEVSHKQMIMSRQKSAATRTTSPRKYRPPGAPPHRGLRDSPD